MTIEWRKEEVLLDFVQGRLSADERVSFETEMAADPALAAEVAALTGVRAALKDVAVDARQREQGWRRLSEAIDAEPAGAAATNDNRWFRRLTEAPLLRVAGVAAAAVFAWELGVAPLVERQETQRYVPVAEAPASIIATVAFAPDAPIGDVSALLRRIGATIADGPSALGIYRLRFADEQARDAGLSDLEAETMLVLTATPG